MQRLALEEEARQALAARETRVPPEAEAVLARKSAELEAHAEAVLAERLAAFEAEARIVQDAREALLAAEVQAAHDAKAAEERVAETRMAQQALAAELENALADARATLTITPGPAPVRADPVAAIAHVDAAAGPSTQLDTPAWRNGAVAEPPSDVAVVLPIARPTLKLQQSGQQLALPGTSREASLVELLRSAAAHRASTVYAALSTPGR